MNSYCGDYARTYIIRNGQALTEDELTQHKFAGDLGHTIEFHMGEWRYFEAGNQTTLGEVRLFTFEQHIQRSDGCYGFKKEDIYYFQNVEIVML